MTKKEILELLADLHGDIIALSKRIEKLEEHSDI